MTNINMTRNALDAIMQRAIDALMIECADFDTDRIIDIIDTCDYDDSLIAYALCDIIDNCCATFDITAESLRDRIDATRDALRDITD